MFPLGRRVEHDARSWAHDVEMWLANKPVKAVEWPRYSAILDQGDLGSCTGNAMAGWLGCAPHAVDPAAASRYDEAFARALYSLATTLDKYPGAYPPDDSGSSGLAVAKAAKQRGLIASYSWAFTTAGLLRALQHGPVIVGTVWTNGMFTPDKAGYVTPTGAVAGGHEYLVRGYDPADGGHLICDNSWSATWGVKGSFKVRMADWDTLRRQQADVTVPHV